MRYSSLRIALLSFALIAAFVLASDADYELEVSPEVVGSTPEVLGYNLGHMVPGSNTFDWLRYSEVNGFRMWSSPAHIEPKDDNGVWGDGVASLADFIARRQAVRADPLNQEFINWPMFEENYATVMDGMNRFSVKASLEYAQENEITPLVIIHWGAGRTPYRDSSSQIDWAARWETWQHFYAQAFWLGRHFGVERFQLYNEPDHNINLKMSQEEYMERLKISSDAVQAALADVNRMYDKELSPRISAPVTVAAVTMFHPRPDREGPDQRAAKRGWGEFVMEHRRTPYFDDVAEPFSNFQVYAYQQYGSNGTRYGEQYREMRRLVTEANGGEPLPVIITEFNVLANYMFRRTEDTMHTPARAARLGSILVNLINERADELYVFKFGQTTHSSVDYTAKNGNYWQDNYAEPFHTGGATRGAEAYRLIMRAFQKDRKLLQQPEWKDKSPSDIWVGASYDPEAEQFHLFVVTERSGEATPMQIDLRPWGIETPSLAILEEVSRARHGSVRSLLRIPEDGRLSLELSPETIWHLSVPRKAFSFSLVTGAEDAHVRAGKHSDKNFGDARILKVAGHSTQSDQRFASYLKFRPEPLEDRQPRKVLLRLFLRSTTDNEVLPAHVYGLPGAQWREGELTAANAPSLSLDGGNMRQIADNRVERPGFSALIQGTVTAVHKPQDQFIDVTDFVLNQEGELTFLITQEVRYPSELMYKGEIEIMSREAGNAYAPQLLYLF